MTAWFAALGEPISVVERHLTHEYLRALGIDDPPPVEGVQDWPRARSVATDPAWDRRWWDAEQLERRRLYALALRAHPEQRVLQVLSETVDVDGVVRDAAALAAERFRCTDAGLVGAAAGAASEALYLGALAGLAAASHEHPFRLKHALFAGGRWPLGMLDGRYWLF
jgi:hypothetical protein